MRQKIAFLCLALTLYISSPLVLLGDSGTTRVTFGRRQLSGDLQFVPDSATDLSTTDTWIFQIVLSTGGSGTTISIYDKATSAKYLLNGVSIAANTTYVITFPEGVKMKNGVTWSAGAASTITASIVAFKV